MAKLKTRQHFAPGPAVTIPRAYYVALEQGCDALAELLDCGRLDDIRAAVTRGRKALKTQARHSPDGEWLLHQPEED